MSQLFFQCCYTNATRETDGRVSSGWQAVAVSPDISAAAYRACTRLQNANSTIHGPMRDEEGNVLRLWELCGDGEYLCLLQTQYGLLDRLGRANMFSHAFVFPAREGAVADPNAFLTVAAENFKTGEAEAEPIPAELRRTEPMTIEGALSAAGIPPEAYVTLIRCAYLQVTEKRGEPLYLCYDGTEAQRRAILFAIYWGLPLSLRRRLCTASCPSQGDGGKHLVFSLRAEKYPTWLDPRTGENTLLTPRRERKLERYGFADYAARNYQTLDAAAFFTQLEADAAALGDPTASDELILKLAHQFRTRPDPAAYRDDELEGCLSDALRARSSGSGELERRIAALLDEIRRRDGSLTEETEENLAQRLAAPLTRELAEAGLRYRIHRFRALPAPQAARQMTELPEEDFRRYADALSRDAKGREILDLHFSARLGETPESWDALRREEERSRFLRPRPQTEERLEAAAGALYARDLEGETGAQAALREYLDFQRRLLPESAIPGCAAAAKETYWARQSYESFCTERRGEYQAMETDGQPLAAAFARMGGLLDTLVEKSESEYLRSAQWYLSNLPDPERAAAAVARAALQSGFSGDPDFAEWTILAATARDPEQADSLTAIRDCLAERQLLRLTEKGLLPLERDIRRTPALRPWAERLAKLLLPLCLRCERIGSAPAPLDLWLLLGAWQGENPFDLFETAKPAVLEAESAPTAAESRLLREEPFPAQAEDYIRRRGQEARAVKRWLGELRQEEKRRAAEKGGGSLLDRGLAFLTRREKEEPLRQPPKPPKGKHEIPPGRKKDQKRGSRGH